MKTREIKGLEELQTLIGGLKFEELKRVVVETDKGAVCLVPEGRQQAAANSSGKVIVLVGSNVPKGGSGNYQYVVNYGDGDIESNSVSDPPVTNFARGEIMAVRDALQEIIMSAKGGHVQIVTHSDYIFNCINKYVDSWPRFNWTKKDGGEVAHRDVWEVVASLKQQLLKVEAIMDTDLDIYAMEELEKHIQK